jgi:hypothetical protein
MSELLSEEAANCGVEGGQPSVLPIANVEPIDGDSFKIELLRLSDDPMWDQSVATNSGQGCITSPGGPSC